MQFFIYVLAFLSLGFELVQDATLTSLGLTYVPIFLVVWGG